jgi:hypothetical protein
MHQALFSITSTQRFIHCTDCQTTCGEAMDYMVHDRLWYGPAHASSRQFLCLSCLSRRLGRRLTVDDFTPAPVNNRIRVVLRC